MKMRKTESAVFFLLAVLLLPFSSARGAAVDAMNSKLALEAQIEERLGQMLKSYLGFGEVTVVARVDIEAKKVSAGGTRKWDESEDRVLPGVPAAASMTKKTESTEVKKELVRLGVSNISIWVILGRPVTKTKDARMRKLISDALDLQIDAGDSLNIESTPVVKPPFSYAVGAGALVALMGLILFGAFLYGPFRKFMKVFNANVALVAAKLPDVGSNKEEAAKEEAGDGGIPSPFLGAGSSVLTFDSGENQPLEKYVNKNNVEDLNLILWDDPPDVIAKVIQRLPPKMAIAAIPSHKLTDVIDQFLKKGFDDPEKMKLLMDRIKDKMVGSFGGAARLGNLMQAMDKNTQNTTLSLLKIKDAAFASAVESRFFRFEDLLRYDDTALRRIFRKAGTEVFARCLKGCADETVEAFYEKLGPAIKGLLALRLQNILVAGKNNDAEISILSSVMALSERGVIPELDEVKQAGG